MTLAHNVDPVLAYDLEVTIDAAGIDLLGRLRVPPQALGVVVIAHGSGSTRSDRRNVVLAQALASHRLASVAVDLLLPTEQRDVDRIFDVRLLGSRLTAARRWLWTTVCRDLPVGYFGLGSDAPVALWAASEPHSRIEAVVVRGGRPDLAGARLARITAPTLFLIGGGDRQVLAHNRSAAASMRCEHRVTDMSAPGRRATGSQLAQWESYLSAMWITEHLRPPGPAEPKTPRTSGRGD
ncbi:dienelactone hydrolase family protein [Nocardia salmonicida]|uniref:dienelactone hydrolase family protein n=1 Tax=Nocardia salmonicida TaxID=53431 RepID=UPI0007A3C4EB|nr:alpha/beta hydrolase [Nocardia salmonicida]